MCCCCLVADPFEQDFPEVIEDTLENGPAVTVRFNLRGTLLAAGCSDGTIIIWDFDTRGVSRTLIGHVKIVTSLRCVLLLCSLYSLIRFGACTREGLNRSDVLVRLNEPYFND